MSEQIENYIENQMSSINLDSYETKVKFTDSNNETHWLNWTDVLNYLIRKGTGEF